MRAKRQRLWLPDFPALPVNEALLTGVREEQLSGDAYYGGGILPAQLREPRPALSLVPYWETELHAQAALLDFGKQEEEDLLELSYRPRSGPLTVSRDSASLVPTKNGFLPDENKLIMEASSISIPFADIAAMLPGNRSAAAVKRQYKYLKSFAGSKGSLPAQLAAPEIQVPVVEEAPALQQAAQVNRYLVDREGGDARITLRKNLPQPPRGFTGMAAHGLKSLAGVAFFEEAEVPDPDDSSRVFTFTIREPVHCACFNIGPGPDGSPLISWSDLYTLYTLPDGSKWAEHGYFFDSEDLRAHAKTLGRTADDLIGPEKLPDQHLFKNKNRYHSRIINIEYECWIFKDDIPEIWKPSPDAYFWKKAFDPDSLREVAA